MILESHKSLIRKNFVFVLAMYVAKTVSKIWVGVTSGSTALITDGIHNIYDIIEFLAINIALRFSRKGASEKYPVGRYALESGVGIVIGVLLVSVGWDFLYSGVVKSLSLFGLLESVAPEEIELPVITYLAIFTVLGSASLSLIVYLFESKVAETVMSESLKGDAEELKVDMAIEVFLVLGFVTTKLAAFEYADPLLTVAIAAVPIVAGIKLILGSFRNILNRAIDPNDQKRVLDGIRSVIGVASDETDESFKLRAYSPCKGRVRIEAVVPVKVASGEGIEQVLNIAACKIRTMLHPKYGDIDVFLNHRMISTVDSEKYLRGSIDAYLRDAWECSTRPDDLCSGLLKRFLQADFETAINEAEQHISVAHKAGQDPATDTVFAQYIVAISQLALKGPKTESTREAYQNLRILRSTNELGKNINAALGIALSHHQLEVLIKDLDAEGSIVDKLRKTLEPICIDENIDHNLRAEAAHVLARSYYKISGYNLQKARKWFDVSQVRYNSATTNYAPLFEDRLLTDWGNFEAQFLRLYEAEIYLNRSLVLKELKGDKHGLAISYGCLAGVFARSGRLEEAVASYEKDLGLVTELGITHDIASVQCKLADVRIKQAALYNDQSHLHEAIAGLLLAERIIGDSFFVQKGMLKAYFTMWWLDPSQQESLEAAQRTVTTLEDILGDSTNLYQKAIFNRLAARVEAANGNIQQSRSLFDASAKCFSGMESQADLPVQAALSEVEKQRWSALECATDWVRDTENKLNELITQIELLGVDIRESLQHITLADLKRMRRKLRRITQETGSNSDYWMDANTILNPLDRFLWFFEL